MFSLNILTIYDVQIAGALVALDRQEKGTNSDLMASAELKKDGINIYEIISLDGLLSAQKLISLEDLDRIKNYRSKFRGNDG